jgi:cell shape-determining protein MreC
MVTGVIGIVGLQIAGALKQSDYPVETITFSMILASGIILGIVESVKRDNSK